MDEDVDPEAAPALDFHPLEHSFLRHRFSDRDVG
jgi:hypothetical protein